MPGHRVRSSVLCLQGEHILALKYRTPDTPVFWGVPGGEIELNETPLQAALRETFEETGYIVELVFDPELCTEYDFVWNKHVIPCRTHWFVVRPRPDIEHVPRAGDEEFITGMRWLPLAERTLLFTGYPVIQQAIDEVLQRMNLRGTTGLTSHNSR